MTPAELIDALKTSAQRASAAEDKFRSEIAQRTKALEVERAFAFRRLNLMTSLIEAVSGAESEEIAVANATAALRTKLGWSEDSEARTDVLSRFAPVAQQLYATAAPSTDEDAESPDVLKSLAEFEEWYAKTHTGPFWALFDVYIPETPRVDF
ncbi:MAG: hypothetical protein JO254_16730 [Pseudolabrys sp.]|nr:hypothetical protein [Pseudolabrys sp.]